MAEYPRELEIQRLNNLAVNFGWEKVREETQGTDVLVTFRKTLHEESAVTTEAPPS